MFIYQFGEENSGKTCMSFQILRAVQAGLFWQVSVLHRGVRAGPQCQGWHGRVCVLSWWKHHSDIQARRDVSCH